MTSEGRQRRRLTATETDLGVVRQRAYLVGILNGRRGHHFAEASLDELARLVETAGSDSVGESLLKRERFDPATLIGKGQANVLAGETAARDVDVVVFDHPLSPVQQRNLQQIFGCDVVDRTALILDIFALHARSRAGMLQVELAQLRYRLPRLRGKGIAMSRLAGGIGTRGPGESKLETDRRRIASRISKLESELRKIGRVRDTQRKARRRTALPLVALVGYTNAGKSTLLNQLTGADVLTENQLFSTVDPTVRRLELAPGPLLLSDTVGFVRDLPHELVEAFRSTLEQVVEADLLLHVVDASDPDPDGQMAAVRTVLEEIGAAAVPELLVFNKADVADPPVLRRLTSAYESSVGVSALTGEGMADLLAMLEATLRSQSAIVELVVPYDHGEIVAALHREGEVVKTLHEDDATRVMVRLPQDALDRYTSFRA